jgi:TatA/E family protein of Tat protein translocase
MGPLGWQETVFIFLLALLLFGPKKLPELGRTLGKAMTEFRRASSELKATFDREMRTLEQETESIKQIGTSTQYQYDTQNYDYSSYETSHEGSYGYENHDSTAASTSTTSASATEGAESPSAVTPEGAVAHGVETAAVNGAGEHPEVEPAANNGHSEHASATTEHRA